MMAHKEFDDVALNRLMQVASVPRPPHGASDRLLRKAHEERVATESNVVAFPVSRIRHWFTPGNLSAISALAASLAVGIYLGASGAIDGLVPTTLADFQSNGLAGYDDPFGLDAIIAAEGSDET